MDGISGWVRVVLLCLLVVWLSFSFGLLAAAQHRAAKAAARASPPPGAVQPCRV
jgi:hypothetical protein